MDPKAYMSQSRLAPLLEMTALLAEDDRVVRDSLARTLGLYFGQVLVAGDGDKALRLFQAGDVHVACLDIVLPGPSGLELAARFREQEPDLPVIILTCHDDFAYMQSAIRMGLTDYLLKPIKLAQLHEALARCVEGMRLKDRLEVRLAGGAVFSPATGRVVLQGTGMLLTRNEKRFLNYLLRRRGVMVDAHVLCMEMDPEQVLNLNSLRVLVHRLRAKIGREALVCSKDIGYMTP